MITYHFIGQISRKERTIAHQECKPPELLIVDSHLPSLHTSDTCKYTDAALLGFLEICSMLRVARHFVRAVALASLVSEYVAACGSSLLVSRYLPDST